jgi:predicted kinase
VPPPTRCPPDRLSCPLAERGASVPLMATLFLICGLPGSGKTTLARRLESEHGALRLTPDEWMMRIVRGGSDEATRAAVESVQWEIAQRVLTLGVNVILESGFWTRSERDRFRARATELGAETKLMFLDASRDELAARIAARNDSLPPNTFRVEEAQLDDWIRVFEPPTADELE